MLECGMLASKKLRDLAVLGMFAVLASGCNSPDRVIDIPAALDTAPKSIEAIKNYDEALSAIVPVMVRELKLPSPQGRLYFYSDAGAYQAALATELKSHFWPEGESRQARNSLEFELFKLTTNLAQESGAITMNKKVFIAEWSMMRLPWRDRVRTLAHELTHVIQSNLSAGRSQLMHHWLVEGFADWVSFKVVDALGTKDFFNDQIRQACRYKIADLRELAAVQSWHGPLRKIRYGQSVCVVHHMSTEDGVPAILNYVRLFKEKFDTEQNFATAFGKSDDAYNQELHAQVKSTGDFGPLN